MVLVTIPLNEHAVKHASQTQCPECGNTVWIDAQSGSRVALVCKNPGKYSVRVMDAWSRNHDWSLYAG